LGACGFRQSGVVFSLWQCVLRHGRSNLPLRLTPTVSPEEAKTGVALIGKQYTINTEANVAGTRKPLDKQGTWGMRAAQLTERTAECDAEGATCRVVVYRAGQPETVCTWTVLTSPADAPRVVEENEAARTLLLRVIHADDKPLPRLAEGYYAEMPPIARAAHQFGDVRIMTVVNKQGEVVGTAVLSGPLMLQGAALDAVKHWKFDPLLVDGKGQAFEEIVTFSFDTFSVRDSVPRK
jgi:TonB family protein